MVKRKADEAELDEQFNFDAPPDWKNGKNQKILGTDYIIHKPLKDVGDLPKNVEFEIKDQEQVWGFGFNTRFRIRGQFQYQTPATAEAAPGPWTGVPQDHNLKCLVAPNFIEKLITGIDIFHGNNKINISNEAQEVVNFVNTWKYAHMDQDQKQLLCPEMCHPGRGVPTLMAEKGWTLTAGSEWIEYSKEIFKGDDYFNFSYCPIDTPFFFQGSNYFSPGHPQKIVPFPIMDRILIRLKFNERPESIFQIPATNKNKYRFIFTDIDLVAEQLRLSKPVLKTIENMKSFPYEGVTRINKFQIIPEHTTSHLCVIQDVFMPQGIFVFAVKSPVLSGLDDMATFNKTVFEQHKIAKCGFKFNRQEFYTEEPNISMIGESVIEHKLFYDYLTCAPFNLTMDKKKITLAQIKDGWKNSLYPHVYINLANYGDNSSRLVPSLNDGSILQKSADLELKFTFESGGSPADVAYIIYLYYTDNYLTLELKNKKNPVFTSPYIKII